MKGEPLELDIRSRIYQLIEREPGLHFREIQRRLELSTGKLEYHLQYMEKREIIVARRSGHYTRYYPVGKQGQREKSLLFLIRQRRVRQILIYLLLEPGLRPVDLARKTGLTPATISYYVKKVESSGVLVVDRRGKEKYIRLTDPEGVADILVRYRESFLDDMVNRFVETWLDV